MIGGKQSLCSKTTKIKKIAPSYQEPHLVERHTSKQINVTYQKGWDIRSEKAAQKKINCCSCIKE